MISLNKVLLLTLTFWGASAFGDCTIDYKNYRSILNCALEKHPNVKRAHSDLNVASALEDQASQFINPELESSYVTGDSLGDRITDTEVSLTQTVELGGKRGSRMEIAEATKNTRNAELKKSQEKVFEETLLTLYRLRQIKEESFILQEALDTFQKISEQFRSRPSLTADQQVAFGIFQLALGDYRFKKSALDNELDELQQKIELSIGQPFDIQQAVLPQEKKKWPEVNTSQNISDFQDAATKIDLAEITRAQAQYELAKADSWPDLKLGPIFQYKAEGGISYPAYGFSISLPLPIFTLNGGGRAVAQREVLKSEENRLLSRQEKEKNYNRYITRYQRAVTALQNTLSVEEIEKKHRNVDRLFRQGLVGGTTVVEAHRQILDFTKSKNEQELSALESLTFLLSLQGKLFQEDL